jgi:putative transposase
MVDGVFPGKESCVVVALAIDADGNKHLLDFEEGSSESAEMVKSLFARLHARGVKAGTARKLLLVRDGSEAIAKAVRHFWPAAVQQECLVHVERGLCVKLFWKHQKEVVERMNRLRRVQSADAGEEAFEELLEFVREKNLAAAEVLANRKDGILAFHRLNVPTTFNVTFNVTFLSNNHIENVMRNSRGLIGKVSRWNPKTDQLSRWMGGSAAARPGRLPAGQGTQGVGATGHRPVPARENVRSLQVRPDSRIECPSASPLRF